jgi:hypothetical protein
MLSTLCARARLQEDMRACVFVDVGLCVVVDGGGGLCLIEMCQIFADETIIARLSPLPTDPIPPMIIHRQ